MRRALRTNHGLKVTAMLLFALSMSAFLVAWPGFRDLSYGQAYSGDGYHDYMECQEIELVHELMGNTANSYLWNWQDGTEATFHDDYDPNYFYIIRDTKTGKTLSASPVLGDYREMMSDSYQMQSWEEDVPVEYDFDTLAERASAIDAIQEEYPDASIEFLPSYGLRVTYAERQDIDITVSGYLRAKLEPKGYVYETLTQAQTQYDQRNLLLVATVGGGLLALLTLAYSTWAAGWNKGSTRPELNGNELHWVPALLLGCIASVVGLVVSQSRSMLEYVTNILSDPVLLAIKFAVCLLCALVGIWCWLCLVRQIKSPDRRAKAKASAAHGWEKTKAGFGWLADVLAHFWGLVAIVLALIFLEALCVANGTDALWVLLKIPEAALVLYVGVALSKLKHGGEEIAAGNTDHQVSLDYLKGDFKTHAETLNNIRAAVLAAVEEQMKAERMKTELITNVSHDIKTPLTSIVNYVDLLKKQEMPTPEAKEYLEVLDRQAAKLKKLTEDLVEAAKATAGTTNVDFQRTDVNVLLTQSTGEYQERLQARELTLLLTPAPDNPAIYADGRLLWRIFENLLSNIYKYAQPGTRVYLTCEAGKTTVTITFRNISATPLNISADELMERFVRGDAARHTEGSGLGLSIARSLTQLQHGTFDLSIDGDLFKATLTFPRMD